MTIVRTNKFTFLSVLEYIQCLIINITELEKIRFLFCSIYTFFGLYTLSIHFLLEYFYTHPHI